jgi:hypothetical protein
MTRKLVLYVCVLAAILANALPLFSQNPQFDIAMEGPWIFYPVNNVQLATNGGKAANALIAVAPVVSHHYPLVFTSGTGGLVDPGVYCVGFDTACSLAPVPSGSSGPPQISSDSYYAHHHLPITDDHTASWTVALSQAIAGNAYFLILPVPHSWSADGTYVYDFETNPHAPIPAPFNNQQEVAIGTQLHYTNQNPAVKNFNLTSCNASQTSSTPLGTTFTCQAPLLTPQPQENSGTLRIGIKSPDYFGELAQCDHHVQLAYHDMFGLIPGAQNPQLAYIFDPQYYTQECAVCDPQLSYPNDCMDETPMIMVPTIAEIRREIDELVSVLQEPNAANPCTTQPSSPYQVKSLQCFSTVLSGGVANLQTLADLVQALLSSQKDLLEVTVVKKESMKVQPNLSPQSKTVAFAKIQTLITQVYRTMDSAASGKDCRAAEMVVQ